MMSRTRPTTPRPPVFRALAAVLVAVGLLAAPPAGAQLAGRAPAPAADGLRVHHSFPEAGRTLRIVVEGFAPGGLVQVVLDDVAAAPPSVVEALYNALITEVPHPRVGALSVALAADDAGLVTLVVPLVDAADTDASCDMLFRELQENGGATRTVQLHLLVQPPTLLLPADDHVLRLDLRSGELIEPSIPGRGLVAAAFSSDGLLGHLLRPEGVLETWSARDWGGSPFAVTRLDPASDDLAHGDRVGPAFVIVRPQGEPFTPPGRLVFLPGAGRELVVEPLGEDVPGRRWAVEPDGFTAFVAEDDLLVRQVDLLRGEPRDVFTAGLPGDLSIADLLLVDGRLLVVSRRGGGRPGSLSVLDLATGWLSLFPLGVDPQRLVAVGQDRVLVVPAAESVETAGSVVVVEAGVPAAPQRLPLAGAVLDAAASPDGARLLVRSPDGGLRLDRWQADGGLSTQLVGLPDATRLVSSGDAFGVLFGGEDGLVHRVGLLDGSVEAVPGARTRVDPAFAVLP